MGVCEGVGCGRGIVQSQVFVHSSHRVRQTFLACPVYVLTGLGRLGLWEVENGGGNARAVNDCLKAISGRVEGGIKGFEVGDCHLS